MLRTTATRSILAAAFYTSLMAPPTSAFAAAPPTPIPGACLKEAADLSSAPCSANDVRLGTITVL